MNNLFTLTFRVTQLRNTIPKPRNVNPLMKKDRYKANGKARLLRMIGFADLPKINLITSQMDVLLDRFTLVFVALGMILPKNLNRVIAFSKGTYVAVKLKLKDIRKNTRPLLDRVTSAKMGNPRTALLDVLPLLHIFRAVRPRSLEVVRLTLLLKVRVRNIKIYLNWLPTLKRKNPTALPPLSKLPQNKIHVTRQRVIWTLLLRTKRARRMRHFSWEWSPLLIKLVRPIVPWTILWRHMTAM